MESLLILWLFRPPCAFSSRLARLTNRNGTPMPLDLLTRPPDTLAPPTPAPPPSFYPPRPRSTNALYPRTHTHTTLTRIYAHVHSLLVPGRPLITLILRLSVSRIRASQRIASLLAASLSFSAVACFIEFFAWCHELVSPIFLPFLVFFSRFSRFSDRLLYQEIQSLHALSDVPLTWC